MTAATFPSIDAFYAADPQRARSGEMDFGVHWAEGPEDLKLWPRWRISVIRDTGEVYAAALGGKGEVRILGHVSISDAYAEAEEKLAGWADEWNRPISWAQERL